MFQGFACPADGEPGSHMDTHDCRRRPVPDGGGFFLSLAACQAVARNCASASSVASSASMIEACRFL